MSNFVCALEENNLLALQAIPKSDLHNHATRGGNIRDFLIDHENLPCRNFQTLDEMQVWYDRHVKVLFKGREGFTARLESAFRQAVNDGVQKLSLSFGIGDKIHFDNSTAKYIEAIQHIQHTIAPDLVFIPEISFMRTHDVTPIERVMDEILDFDFFKAIDLVGDDRESVENFKGIYRKAQAKGLVLKAHLGEFGCAESIRKGIECLELKHVQHGIRASDSKEVMRWLERNAIQLNICPSSNVMLNRVASYKEHPIRGLFEAGVKVTINSDDMLIFNQSVSEEYLNLYNSGCLSATSLEVILQNGMT